MNQREIRGKQIVEKNNQISRIDESYYKVNSQSRKIQHDIISLESDGSCSCEDRFFRKTCCKHIHAVEISLKLRKAVKESIVIDEVSISSCQYCNSDNIKKQGLEKIRPIISSYYSARIVPRDFQSI